MITTIFATHSAVESLTVGNALTVTAPSGGAGFVQRVFNAATVDETAIDSASSQTFGPYAVVMQFRIGCSAVSVAFSQAPATDSLAPTESGAVAFTDLIDAPGTITPNAVLVGNDAGTALRASEILTITEDGLFQIVENGESGVGVLANGDGGVAISGDGEGGVNLYASGVGGINLIGSGAGPVKLAALGSCVLELQGMDVAATDATATMTVDAVEYSIAKAIKVKIGSDTYWWPLYGPLAP